MLGKGAKRTLIDQITVITQYCWDKTIARSGILSLVIRCSGFTNTSLQNFAIRISSVEIQIETSTKMYTPFLIGLN